MADAKRRAEVGNNIVKIYTKVTIGYLIQKAQML